MTYASLPFVPSDIDGGPVYEFSIYHLVEVDDPLALFPIRMMDVLDGVASREEADA